MDSNFSHYFQQPLPGKVGSTCQVLPSIFKHEYKTQFSDYSGQSEKYSYIRSQTTKLHHQNQLKKAQRRKQKS